MARQPEKPGDATERGDTKEVSFASKVLRIHQVSNFQNWLTLVLRGRSQYQRSSLDPVSYPRTASLVVFQS